MFKTASTFLADALPRGSVKIHGCIDTRSAVEQRQGIFHPLHERRDPEIPLPCNLREQDRAFFERLRFVYCAPTFLASLPNGAVCQDGVVLTSDGLICRDVSFASGFAMDAHPLLRQSLSRAKKRHNVAAVIASRGADCYYHWMLDILPRLALLGESTYDTLVVPHALSYQRETLKALGLHEKCAAPPRRACRFYDTLLIPSLPGYSGMPTPDSIRFLQKCLGSKTAQGGKKLYISRGDAAKRKVVGEAGLVEELKTRGFEVCRLTGMPIADQIELFANADIVIAPHGASLTNVVFCKPGTAVIELFHPEYAHWCYWYLAALSGLNYYYHLPPGPEAVRHDKHFAAADLSIDPKALIQLIENIL
ncbi:MAG: glycosyltransferase family 61 protein [Chthoniobacterales bacterium]